MLENLINTKLKKKLLNVLFALPKRAFTLQELRLMTEGSKKALSQGLREFTKSQVANTTSRKQKKFYRINVQFPLYDELQDLVSEGETEMEDEVVKKLKKLPNVQLAILSGIFSFQPHLQVDLLLVGNDINRLRLHQVLAEIRKITGQELSYTVMNKDEYEYRRLMSDRFVRDILDNPHLVVINSLK